MSSANEKYNIKIPESTLRLIEDAQETYKKLTDNIAKSIPKFPEIKIPSFQIPFPEERKIKLYPPPDVVREQNTWKRHQEILNVQSAVLEIQTKILREQKSTTRLTLWILSLSIAGIMISIVSIIIKK